MSPTTTRAPAIPAAREAGQRPGAAPELAVLPQRPSHSLSPSRAADFVACPRLYRLRVIDQVPEPPSPAAARGSLIHLVLERLHQLPASRRTLAAAVGLLPTSWADLAAQRPELAAPDSSWGGAQWVDGAAPLLVNYFKLEDPTGVAPIGGTPATVVGVEVPVSAALPSGLALRGYLDRVDASATGALRVIDYKSGRSPGPGHDARAMFQLRFYALALLHSRDVVATELRLMYLADGVALRFQPDLDDLTRTARRIEAIWTAIEFATNSGAWPARPSARCNWCAHRGNCPAWGAQPPEVDESVAQPDPGSATELCIDLTQGA